MYELNQVDPWKGLEFPQHPLLPTLPVGLYLLILYMYVCVLFTHTGVAESGPISMR